MKTSRIIILGFITFMLIGPKIPVNASLIDNGDGTITDTATNLMWLQDVTYSGYMSHSAAISWADTLSVAGYEDWRLPSLNGLYCGGMNSCIGSELGNLYYSSLEYHLGGSDKTGPFTGLADWDEFWFGDTWNNEPTESVYVFAPPGGFHGFYPPGGMDAQVWAVRVVPEPISSTLFIVGGATLGISRLRKRINRVSKDQ